MFGFAAGTNLFVSFLFGLSSMRLSLSIAMNKTINLFTKRIQREMTDRGRPLSECCFTETCLTSKSLHCKELVAHTDQVKGFDFSFESKFLASAGSDGHLLLWPINKEIFSCEKPKPTVVKQPIYRYPFDSFHTLSFSPDSDRLYSGTTGGYLFIHDLERYSFPYNP